MLFQADAPNASLIPDADAVGVTVVLITCTYRDQEFIRVGYYVNNEYTDPELKENPPMKPDYAKVRAMEIHCFCSLKTKLEVTAFKIGVPIETFPVNTLPILLLCGLQGWRIRTLNRT